MKPCPMPSHWMLIFAMALLPFPPLHAAGPQTSGEGVVNKLFGPGPLIHGHRDLEHGDCLKCHDAGKGVPDGKCLACHKPIADSIRASDTFHARVKKPCIACHTDHKGRKFDSMAVDTHNFKHSLTGFELTGAHARTKCVECHKTKRTKNPFMSNETKFFGLEDSCKSCHKKDDIHHFKPKFAAKECSACHGTQSWKANTKFDHHRETGYDLVGKHTTLKCTTCHNPKGKNAPKYDFPGLDKQKCLTCHTDFHRDGLEPRFKGGNCDQCHAQTTWKLQSFRHDITGFPLHGAHAKVSCVNCHSKTPNFQSNSGKHPNWLGLETTCAACHKDYHGFGTEKSDRGVLLKKCETCHNDMAWMNGVLFDHGRDTGYPITGKHHGVKCFACHKPQGRAPSTPNVLRGYEFPQLQSKDCETCHKNPHPNDSDSVFSKQKCSGCHTTTGWKNLEGSGAFNHNATRFPLTGDHTKVTCKECHTRGGKQVYKFPGADRQFCESCHSNVHKEQFSPKFFEKPCVDCHNTTTFTQRLPFDHGSTDFRLTGAHGALEKDCTKCHVKTTRMLPTRPPKAASKFLFANSGTGYCESCHANVHEDQFHKKFSETPCRTCHNTDSFSRNIKFDHSLARMNLRGKHKEVKCVECHVRTKERFNVEPFHAKGKFVFQDLQSKNCLLCHEDEHDGRFGKDCTRCHNENSWTANADYHKNFLLSGIHKTLDCNECHREGRRLTGTGQDCIFCHTKDDRHQGSLPNCAECHTQFFWSATRFQHGLTTFPLRGAHRLQDCEACHAKGVYQGLSETCISCHFKDSLRPTFPVHSGAGFDSCEQCHNQFSFSGAKE